MGIPDTIICIWGFYINTYTGSHVKRDWAARHTVGVIWDRRRNLVPAAGAVHSLHPRLGLAATTVSLRLFSHTVLRD